MPGNAANLIILAGIVLLLAGVLLKTGLLGWFGNLPGDVQIRRDGFRFYFPLTSMILVSVVLSLLLNFIRRFF